MRYQILGKTDLRVSEVAMGGVGAMGKYGLLTPGEFAKTMRRAEEMGMNFMDTAPAYGDSEVVFGHYLRDHRDKWIVCTKIGTCASWGCGELLTRDRIFRQVENSMKRLCTDYIDVLLIHGIDQYGDGIESVDKVLHESEMIDAMRDLQLAGKVRFIGVSGTLPELTYAAASGFFDVVLTYNTYNLLMQSADKELFPLAQEKNIGVVLAGAFYQGLVTDPDFVLQNKELWFEKTDPAYYDTDELLLRRERLLRYVNHDMGKLKELAVRFCLSHPAVSVLVSGMRKPEEVEENIRIANLGPMSAAEIKEMLSIMLQPEFEVV